MELLFRDYLIRGNELLFYLFIFVILLIIILAFIIGKRLLKDENK